MAYSDQANVLFQSPKYGRALGWFRCFWTRQRGGPLSLFTLSWFRGTDTSLHHFNFEQLVVWNDSFAHPNMVRQVNIYRPFPVVVTGYSGIIQDPYTTLSSLMERIETESTMSSELPVKR